MILGLTLFYILRHIICGISENEAIESVKEKYYKNYRRDKTDEFNICRNMKEVNQTLKKYNIKQGKKENEKSFNT